MFEKLGQKIISHYEKKAKCDCNSIDKSSDENEKEAKKEIKKIIDAKTKNETPETRCCAVGTKGAKCC